MKELIYLASPYSDSDLLIREERFRSACRTAAILMNRGHKIFSPIAHTHPIAVEGKLPTDWQFWRTYDKAIMEACKEMWILTIPGWVKSKGVQAERRLAERLGIPVLLVDVEGNVTT
jgi:hypothetical protein